MQPCIYTIQMAEDGGNDPLAVFSGLIVFRTRASTLLVHLPNWRKAGRIERHALRHHPASNR